MRDPIDRQAAIDAIKTSRYLVDAMEKIIKLPSAQPEVIYCKDCANRGRLGSCLVYWRNIKGLTIVPWKPDDYDFCSKAVRRADERL